ncbi:hypothetical protein JCM15831A_29070 [Asaia astilbis]
MIGRVGAGHLVFRGHRGIPSKGSQHAPPSSVLCLLYALSLKGSKSRMIDRLKVCICVLDQIDLTM